MARSRRLIPSTPAEVWRLLADGYRYSEWVAGTQEILHVDPEWPALGSCIRFKVGLGSLTMDDLCVVRRCEPERRLELEAKAGRLGAARIAMGLLPWGDSTLLTVDWHPLRGPGTRLHGLPVDYAVKIRNGMMLTKLARIAAREHQAAPRLVSGAGQYRP